MHPALKFFSILWLFLGVQLATLAITKGIMPYAVVALILCALSITGIFGHRTASMSLTLFWLSVLLYWIVMLLAGKAGPFSRAVVYCLIFAGFAFVAFLFGENPEPEEPEEKKTEPEADDESVKD